ncbi:FMN-binding negative transcriptional regulator [Cognatilysobacter lacus]|uniref:FMN-binding negative transcriptional regulator n=1 Tax=Cognatilysobacter lacus TaxID=1643323 RepID=A0A5D8Z790_9GAMM|nr:FMN-binding negative transcriptional regulator [Lysobacter lacus]TZF90537.1 FMN-binding negative transcriptional regulator [Lysobacter lacus]
MTLYLPRAFDERDLSRLDALAVEHPFATLVTVVDDEPFVSHVPLLYSRDGNRVELRGHVARANPQWRGGGRALAVLHGPHGYVSPAWYPDKLEQARVPTWNYVVAHLSGALNTFDDEASLAQLVGELSERHEAAVGSDWRFNPGVDAERVQLRGIVGFRLVVDRLALKAKLNQNHPPRNREAVAARLEALDDSARGVARWMRAVNCIEGA